MKVKRFRQETKYEMDFIIDEREIDILVSDFVMSKIAKHPSLSKILERKFTLVKDQIRYEIDNGHLMNVHVRLSFEDKKHD
jgi:hypothetical protein